MRKKITRVGTSTTLEPLPKHKTQPKTFTCSRCGHTERMRKPRFMPAAGIKCNECGGQMALKTGGQ